MPVQTRRIDVNNLCIRQGLDSENLVPGGLGFGRSNADLLAQQPVEQGRFPDIGSANQGDVATTVSFTHKGSTGSGLYQSDSEELRMILDELAVDAKGFQHFPRRPLLRVASACARALCAHIPLRDAALDLEGLRMRLAANCDDHVFR